MIYYIGDKFNHNNLSFDEAYSRLKELKYLIMDTETTRRGKSNLKFDLYDTELLFLQLGNKYNQYVFEKEILLDNMPRLSKLFSKLVVGHNVKYDYQVLKLELGITLNKIYDTMIVEQLFKLASPQKDGYFTLAETLFRYTNETPYGDQLSFFDPYIPKKNRMNLGYDWPSVFYAATDIIATDKVYEAQDISEIKKAANIEFEAVLVLGDMELNGMPIDSDRWLDLEIWAAEREQIALQLLQSQYPEIQNWNSQKQVGKLFKSLGIPVEIFDKDKEEYKISVQKIVIAEHAKDFPIITDYLVYKALGKLHSQYGAKFLKHLNPATGRIHSSFLQLMSTGRLSSTNPNMQNIVKAKGDFPEGVWWRESFRAEENRTLIVADYSSQELTLVANLANEKKMLDILAVKGDLHSQTAELVFKVPVSTKVNSHLRDRGKTLNFSILYGVGASKTAHSFKIPLREASNIISNYLGAYDALKKYFDAKYEESLKNNYITISKLGYRAYLPEFDIIKDLGAHAKYRHLVSKSLAVVRRKSQNFPIQGQSAIMTKLALIKLRKVLDKDVKICLAVHDEIVLDAPTDKAEYAKELLEQCMLDAAKIFCQYVPTRGEAHITKTWNK
jgi:DNA polymerase-1